MVLVTPEHVGELCVRVAFVYYKFRRRSEYVRFIFVELQEFSFYTTGIVSKNRVIALNLQERSRFSHDNAPWTKYINS